MMTNQTNALIVITIIITMLTSGIEPSGLGGLEGEPVRCHDDQGKDILPRYGYHGIRGITCRCIQGVVQCDRVTTESPQGTTRRHRRRHPTPTTEKLASRQELENLESLVKEQQAIIEKYARDIVRFAKEGDDQLFILIVFAAILSFIFTGGTTMLIMRVISKSNQTQPPPRSHKPPLQTVSTVTSQVQAKLDRQVPTCSKYVV